MNYQEALAFISKTDWKGSVPGLERIRELLRLMGNPQEGLRYIHVGGSNGKGSVCAFLSHILEKAGYKVGLYISPFIEVFNERMQINNTNISDDELAEITTYIQPFADSMEDVPTEFELKTAIAFEYFARNKCDIVVLEVGMGGELDATNVIPSPLLAVITTISLEHTQYLGDTLEQIARTKSGIIKPGCNTVIYRQGLEVTSVIADRCRQSESDLYISDPDSIEFVSVDIDGQTFHTEEFGTLSTALLGRYQKENLAVALKAVQVLKSMHITISDDAVREGVKATRWPVRFEVVSKDPVFIVDGAHNPQGAKATSDSLDALFKDKKMVMIIGVLADKDYREMFSYLLPHAAEVLCVAPPNPRALSCEDAAHVIRDMGVPASAYDNINDAVDAAIGTADGKYPVCAVGSLYMAGDIKKYVLSRM